MVKVLPSPESTTAASLTDMLVRLPAVSLTSTMLPVPLCTTSLKPSTSAWPGSTVVALPGSRLSATGPWVSMVSVGVVPAVPLLLAASV